MSDLNGSCRPPYLWELHALPLPALVLMCSWIISYLLWYFNDDVTLLLGWKSRDSVPELVEDYFGKKVKVDEFVSHTFFLTDINQAFEVMHQGKR